MNKVNLFANEFCSKVMSKGTSVLDGGNWWISYCYDYDEQECEIYTKVQLSLYDDEGEEIGSIFYDMIRDRKMRYTYNVAFSFEEDLVSECEEVKEFDEIKRTLNLREDGLYDTICAYLHKYSMEQMEIGEDVDIETPPSYKPYYSPSRIESFMKKYGISPYVPIDVEIVDDKGMPIKYLSIKGIGFNDESNNLIVSMSEY